MAQTRKWIGDQRLWGVLLAGGLIARAMTERFLGKASQVVVYRCRGLVVRGQYFDEGQVGLVVGDGRRG